MAATSSRSVDLPTPGSPASSTTPPGTAPPPRTRSSSSTPVGTASAVSTLISVMGRARVLTGAGATEAGAGAPASSTVPQAWHSPQRPTHLRVDHPHSVHRNVDFAALAMADTLSARADTACSVHRKKGEKAGGTGESYLRVRSTRM